MIPPPTSATRRWRGRFQAGRVRRLALALAAALASGSLVGTCETRLKDAFVSGTKDYLYALLDPTNFVSLMSDGAGTADEANE